MADIPWLLVLAALLAVAAGAFFVSGLMRGKVQSFSVVRRESDMAPLSRRRKPLAYWTHLLAWLLVALGNVGYVLYRLSGAAP